MTAEPPRIRTLIVDDERLARRRLRTLLEEETDIEIIADAAGGTAAVQAIANERPDLVVTTDTAVAHLAGALGRTVWLLLSFSPDWRWLLDREDCPWYPSARLFRQPAPGDWPSVVARVQQQLGELVAARARK